MTTLHEHEDAKRETEINALPKVTVRRADFPAMARAAGWREDVIRTLMCGRFPSCYLRIGRQEKAVAILVTP